jgi:hypothetical protein
MIKEDSRNQSIADGSETGTSNSVFEIVAAAAAVVTPRTFKPLNIAAAIASQVITQQGGPKSDPEAAWTALREKLVSLSEIEQRDSSVASRALKLISDDLQSGKISDPTKPLAATVLLDLLDPGSKAVVAEHILTKLNAGGPAPELNEKLVESLKAASLDRRATALKTASLLEKAISDDPDEHSVYKYLLGLITDKNQGSIGELMRYSKAVLDARKAYAANQDPETLLKDSLRLLIGRGPGEGKLSKEELLSVWQAVENVAKRDPRSGDAFIKQVIKSFLAPGVMSSEEKGEIIAQGPASFVSLALPLIAGMSNSHSRSQLVAALPQEQREPCEKLIELHEEVNKLQAASKITELSVGFDSVVGWALQEWQVLRSTEFKPFFKGTRDDTRFGPGEQPDFADLQQAIVTPVIYQKRGEEFSSLGEAVRTINELAPSDKARSAFVGLQKTSAAQELAVVVRDYTAGLINDAEFLLGLVAVALKNPGTEAAKIAESQLEPRLKSLDMGNLWEYVSGKKELGESGARAIDLELPRFLGNCVKDPALQDVAKILLRTLPAAYAGKVHPGGYFVPAKIIEICELGYVRNIDRLAPILVGLLNSSMPEDLRGKALDILCTALQRSKDFDREQLVSLLEPKLIDFLKTGEIARDEKIWDSGIYRYLITPKILDSALEALDAGHLSIQRIIVIFAYAPNQLDAREQALKIEPKLFDFISKEEAVDGAGPAVINTLLQLEQIGWLAGLHEKFLQRANNPSEGKAARSLYVQTLAESAVDESIYRCAVAVARSVTDTKHIELVYDVLHKISKKVPAEAKVSDLEPAIFGLIKGEFESRDRDILVIESLVSLSASGHLQGLPEKLIERLSSPSESSMLKGIYVKGLSELPVTRESFEAVTGLIASCFGDDDEFYHLNTSISALREMADRVPKNLDLGDIGHRMMEMISGTRKYSRNSESIMVALVRLYEKGYVKNLGEEIIARLKDPNASESIKEIYLKGLTDKCLPVTRDALEVLLKLAEPITKEDPPRVSMEVFESLDRMFKGALKDIPDIDVRDLRLAFMDLGAAALRNSIDSDVEGNVSHGLVFLSNSTPNVDDAGLIFATLIDAIKQKGAERIIRMLNRSTIYEDATLTPDLLRTYVDLIAESVYIPLGLESDPDKPVLLADGDESALTIGLKMKIRKGLGKIEELSPKMKEIIQEKSAELAMAIQKEIQKGNSPDSDPLETLSDLLEILSGPHDSGKK